MVEFNHPYRPISQSESKASLEEPIFPISRVGQTIPEYDPSGRHKDIIEVAQAAIRGGSGALQIVAMQVPGRTGRGMHMHGKEVREALREVIKANEVIGVGVELPTSLSNVSGMDWQNNRVDEETRKKHLDEIKSAIEFTGDVFEGGGTDILSWEFPRRFFDAKWNEQDGGKPQFENFPNESDTGVLRFVDSRSGQIVPIPVSKGVYIKEDPGTGEPTDEFQKWNWANFLEQSGGDAERAHQLFKEKYFQNQIEIARAEASRRKENLEVEKRNKRYDLIKDKPEDKLTLKEREDVKYIQDQLNYIESQERIAEEQSEQVTALQSLSSYAKGKAEDSYAELGMYAMDEQSHRARIKRDLYVGPEIGWPSYYGGHPEEFIELIQNSRKRMAQRLEDERGMKKEEAENLANKHIRGTFDTGHVGMWLKHFRPDLPYRKRLEVFEDWFLEKTEQIAKADVVGNIQIVDAHGGEHGHLPPGQGIFPIKKAMQVFKKQYSETGKEMPHIVSEGHEEDRMEDGRIRTQAWRLLGSPIEKSGMAPTGGYTPWSKVQNAYLGRTYSPTKMFGSHAPPFGDYRPWSDIPFE